MHRRCDCDCDGCGGDYGALIILTIRWARAVTFERRRHVAANERPTMHVSSRCKSALTAPSDAPVLPAECERMLRGSGLSLSSSSLSSSLSTMHICVASVRGSSNREERSPVIEYTTCRSDVQSDRSALGYP
ncbi:unnamed protein product [Lasius platythorax]|uniref:Uncharacterized protein n=1 Tax=Lasius platythorax TaxID=488582 RepID=A0AAV2NFX4_9HYME